MLKTLSRNPSSGSSSDAASPTKKSSSGIGKLFGKKGVLTRVASGLKKSNSVKIETPTTSPLSGKEAETNAAAAPAPVPVQQAATSSTNTRPSAPNASASSDRRRSSAAVPSSSQNNNNNDSSTASNNQAASSNGANGGATQGDGGASWNNYRQTRLASVANHIYALAVIFFFVSLYCGDLTPHFRTNDVLPPINFTLVDVLKGISKVPTYKIAILEPRNAPALKRGATMYAGDYLYHCLPQPKRPDAPCEPTFFQLKEDGSLVLARGSSPNHEGKKLWSSKAGNVKDGKYEATYNNDGSLVVRLDGKKVWKQGKFWQSAALRPWPLST